MAEKILNNLELFSPITLTELNAKASYLQRIDRKFLLTAKELSEILEELKEHFQALEIC
jgi:DNA repair ATPase RecN